MSFFDTSQAEQAKLDAESRRIEDNISKNFAKGFDQATKQKYALELIRAKKKGAEGDDKGSAKEKALMRKERRKQVKDLLDDGAKMNLGFSQREIQEMEAYTVDLRIPMGAITGYIARLDTAYKDKDSKDMKADIDKLDNGYRGLRKIHLGVQRLRRQWINTPKNFPAADMWSLMRQVVPMTEEKPGVVREAEERAIENLDSWMGKFKQFFVKGKTGRKFSAPVMNQLFDAAENLRLATAQNFAGEIEKYDGRLKERGLDDRRLSILGERNVNLINKPSHFGKIMIQDEKEDKYFNQKLYKGGDYGLEQEAETMSENVIRKGKAFATEYNEPIKQKLMEVLLPGQQWNKKGKKKYTKEEKEFLRYKKLRQKRINDGRFKVPKAK